MRRMLLGAAETFSGAGQIALRLIFTFGALAKLIDPQPTFQVLQAVIGSAWICATLLTLTVVLETGLAAALWTSLLRGTLALATGILVLAAFTGWLLIAQQTVGAGHECGCLSAIRPSTISEALTGNLIVIGELLLALLAMGVVGLRKPHRPGGSDDGGGTRRG